MSEAGGIVRGVRSFDHVDGLYGDAAVKTFTLRVTGSVRLFGPEISVVSCAEFQRLDGLRQLGTAHMVFRSANHTRFEHSLGTLAEVQRIIEAVNDNPRRLGSIDDTGKRLARMLALVHDVCHIPYGHTLEDEFFLLDRHDVNRARRQRLVDESEIGRHLRSALDSRIVAGGQSEFDLLQAALDGGDDGIERLGRWAYVLDLVSNTVCADALDYVARDLTGCGMPVALGDRFLDYFVVVPEDHAQQEHRHRMALRLDKRGMPRPDVASEVYKLLEHRYELVERVFFHHAKNSASAMLARAVQELELHLDDAAFDDLSDDTLRLVLRRPGAADALGLSVTMSKSARALSVDLGQALQGRRLYKLAYLGNPDHDVDRRARRVSDSFGKEPKQRRAVEDELAAMAGLPQGHVLVHIPSPKMLAKKGEVRVMMDDGDILMMAEWDETRAGRLAALQESHRRLWRVSVYVHPDASDAQLALVSEASRNRFKFEPRYAQLPQPDPYFAELFDRHAEARGWPARLRTEATLAAGSAAALSEDGPEGSRNLEANLDLLDVAVRARAGMGESNPDQVPLFGTDGK